MLSFLGFKKDAAKKSSSDRETSDGFVIVGETEDERRGIHNLSIQPPATNVIVQPSKSSITEKITDTPHPSAQATSAKMSSEAQAADIIPALPELLGDVPFTLAPHILAMQAGLPFIPDFTLPRKMNDNLANFHYDFTLENSVLCEP